MNIGIRTIFLAFVSLRAFAQIEAGTFISVNSSQNEIVVAADNRAIVGTAEIDDKQL